MAGPVRDLDDLSRKRADLRVACRDCGHARSLAIADVQRVFRHRMWSTEWGQIARRFRCRKCGSKHVAIGADFYGGAVRHQRQPAPLKAVPTTLRPGLRPPPPGVSIAEWNAADERERRRLVDRLRS